MKIAIIGSRTFNDWVKFNTGVHDNMSNTELLDSNTCLISGGAVGTDSLAERFSVATAIPIEVIKPDYAVHGKAATHIRNREIIDKADKVIAFWDGQSRGTKSVIEYAQKMKKDLRIIKV